MIKLKIESDEAKKLGTESRAGMLRRRPVFSFCSRSLPALLSVPEK